MAARDPENKRKASKWWPREAYYSRQGPRKQEECIKVVVLEVFSPADRAVLRFFLEKSRSILYNSEG